MVVARPCALCRNPVNTSLAVEILLIVALIAVNAVLAASEIALVTARRARFVQLAQQKNPNAEAALRLLGNTGRFLATIQVGITIAGFFASAVGAVSFVLVFSSFLDRIPVPLIQQGSEALAVIVVTLIISFVTIVLGELVPKHLAIRYAETISLAVAQPLERLASAIAPLVAVLNWTANLVLKVLGLQHLIGRVRPTVTETELRMMFDVAATEGEIEAREARMLHKMFAFTDALAKEIMTPRPDILWLDQDATLGDFLPMFEKSYHARYPLCDGDPDNALGLLYIKDVLQGIASGALSPESRLLDLLRPAYFVPETKRVGELFEEMRSGGHAMAIIVDEYGGTAGLVTLKQLVQEIVGHIQEEGLGFTPPAYTVVGESAYEVDGAMRIDQLNEALSLELPEGEYETVAGFLLHRLGHIPQVGEHIQEGTSVITVTEVQGVKVERVHVRRTTAAREERG